MDLDDFKGISKKEKPLPTDTEGWVGLFLNELDLPELSNYSDLMVYLDKYESSKVESSKGEDLVKEEPHYWDSLNDDTKGD